VIAAEAFAPGQHIVERHLMFGVPIFGRPLTVVSDGDGVLATYLAIGTPMFGAIFDDRATAMDEIATGSVRWGERTWVQHNVLCLVRAADPYTAMAFWNEEGTFVSWYINLQDPMRRTAIGFDSRDHFLDLIVGEDLASWMWKDEHELDAGVKMGIFSPEEAATFRRNGEEVVDLVSRGEAWWGEWRDWAPDPSWPIPMLPEDWDRVD